MGARNGAKVVSVKSRTRIGSVLSSYLPWFKNHIDMTCGKNIQIDIFKYRYMKYTNDMDKETRI